MTPDNVVYVCNAADLKDSPKNMPRGTLAGQLDVGDTKHSYVPKPKSKRTLRNTPIDSSSSQPGDPIKRGGEVPVQSVPDLFNMPPTHEEITKMRAEQAAQRLRAETEAKRKAAGAR